MYRQQSRGFQSNNRRGGGQRPVSRFSRKQKYIDPALFVKKAIVQEQETYAPEHSFADFPLHGEIQRNITEHGYTTPTPIQDQAILPILEGKDVIGIANTGTGKTAAFLLPLIHKVFTQRDQKVLIIAPTRELAVQIDEEFKAFARHLQLSSVICIGGVNINPQIRQLYRRPQFVIGTPGRLKDLERQHKLNFAEYQSVVLDEVDRMLDMGFIHDVKYIVTRLPSPRHTLFFSATLPDSVQQIMKTLVTNPITVSVKSQATSLHVDQDVIKTRGKQKVDVLHDLLVQDGFDKVLVFGRTKWGMEKLAKEMEVRGFKVASIHGNKNQNQRQRAIEQFKTSQIQVLLATDVASRGLDISNVTHVINYDLPESYEDYIHRIGRTGRAGKKGTALTFID